MSVIHCAHGGIVQRSVTANFTMYHVPFHKVFHQHFTIYNPSPIIFDHTGPTLTDVVTVVDTVVVKVLVMVDVTVLSIR